jgi:FKBP-type peptidyl-prolyl cis-trans isomerase
MAKPGYTLCLCLAFCGIVTAFHPLLRSKGQGRHEITSLAAQRSEDGAQVSRRGLFIKTAAVVGSAAFVGGRRSAYAATPNGLPLTTSSSGLKWADAKVGSGQPVQNGATVSIDYSIASTAGRFPQIYTTKDKGQPYRWTLGDGSTIEGIEKAIIGDSNDGIPPMLPGGVRRVIVPSALGYEKLSKANAKCIEGENGSIGPIPPKSDLGAYQRWYSFYCNPRIPYQPDLVLDIKLYGRRT